MQGAAPARSGVRRCRERDDILDQLWKAIGDILSIDNEEAESVISGNLQPRDASISHRLKELRELKALLIGRLQRHRGEHGC